MVTELTFFYSFKNSWHSRILASLEREILWAATEDRNELVEQILLKDPSMVHVCDRDGYTPLHKACYNNNYELAQLLLKYKADPNRKTEYQWTALHSACKWNNAKLAALVLQHGADVNARSEGDQTPLHITASVSTCRDTLVTLLMNPKLNPDLKNNSDDSAYQIAKRTGLTEPLFGMIHPALSVETGLIEWTRTFCDVTDEIKINEKFIASICINIWSKFRTSLHDYKHFLFLHFDASESRLPWNITSQTTPRTCQVIT